MIRTSPKFTNAKLEKLHPTQLTVGKAEVEIKRTHWQKLKRKERLAALADHWFPGIIGPGGQYYIVDHHHFGLALQEEGVKDVCLLVLKDLSFIDIATFWRVLEHNQWVRPFDAKGMRQDYTTIPDSLTKLQDDPYRSLAGLLRRAGGYAKDTTPYSEFLWTDFLRQNIPPKTVAADMTKATQKALKLAHSQEARYLPGWAGEITV